MQPRILVLECDDPEQPGLLIRRYARIVMCWEPTLGGYCWFQANAAGERVTDVFGPYAAAEAALDAAEDELGGVWEPPPPD